MNTFESRPRKWGIWVLFLSFPTLICCAIPIILVSLGMGSVVASLYSENVLFLSWFSNNKMLVFTISTSILTFSYWLLFRPGRACPSDPQLAQACAKARYWNIRFLIAATTIWALSAFSTFGLIHFI